MSPTDCKCTSETRVSRSQCIRCMTACTRGKCGVKYEVLVEEILLHMVSMYPKARVHTVINNLQRCIRKKISSWSYYWILENRFLVTVVIQSELQSESFLKITQIAKNWKPPSSWDSIQKEFPRKKKSSAFEWDASSSWWDTGGNATWPRVQSWPQPSCCWPPRVVLFCYITLAWDLGQNKTKKPCYVSKRSTFW